jgi:hypothetical protein
MIKTRTYLATYTPDALAHDIRLPPMRRGDLYGQRSAPTSSQRSRRERVARLARRLQRSSRSRPAARRHRCTLGRSRNPGADIQGARTYSSFPFFLLLTYLVGEEQTLDTIHTSFPRTIAPYLPGYVTASLRHLHALYPTYVQYYLADSTAVPNSSEGEPIELYKLAAPLVDFVTGATRQSRARVSFDEGTLAQLVDALVQWAQMTKENVRAPKCLSHE